MRRILIGLLLCVSCISCRNPQIGYANVEELIYSIKLTEMYIKKIPALTNRTDRYVTFGLTDDGHIDILGSTYHYNPNDTTWEGRNNYQKMVDTCRVFPGLTVNEWQDLKKQLGILRNMKIVLSDNAFYNDGKFQFFYYSCLLPDYQYSDRFCLALLSDEIVQTEDFKDRFLVVDKEKELYLLYEIY